MRISKDGETIFVNDEAISESAYRTIFSEALAAENWAALNSQLAATGESQITFVFENKVTQAEAVRTMKALTATAKAVVEAICALSDELPKITNPELMTALHDISKGGTHIGN